VRQVKQDFDDKIAQGIEYTPEDLYNLINLKADNRIETLNEQNEFKNKH
jgi:hypothetical protein